MADQQTTEHPVEHHHQVVDPWTVEAGPGGIDYDKLIAQFGCERVSNELIERIERITKKPAHPWLKRGYFCSHRYLSIKKWIVQSLNIKIIFQILFYPKKKFFHPIIIFLKY